jgi:negative regulator of flagellin synthesis FlgM
MRIDTSGFINQIQGVKLRGLRPTDGVNTASPDTVSLTNGSDDFRVAMQALTSAPDVRADKVADLQKQIEAGTYKSPVTDLADKLLDRRV